MSSIRYKILSLCLVLAIVPTVAVSAYGVYSTINALQLNSLKEQDTKISLLGKQLDRALSAVKSDILYFRYSTSMQDLIIKSADPKLTFEQRMAARGRLAKDFLAFSEQRPMYHQLRFLSKYGKEVVRVDRVGGKSKIVTQLEDRKGRYYVNNTLILKSGEVMVSHLDLYRENGKIKEPVSPVIRYGTPVFGRYGKLHGILLFNVSASNFLETLQQSSTSKNERLIMVDPDGYYLLHPDKTKLWGSLRDKNTGERIQQDLPSLGKKIVGLKGPSSLFDGENIITVKPVDNGIDDNRNLGFLVNFIATDTIFEPAIKARKFYIVITLLTLLLATVIVLIMARKITRPIVDLTVAAEDMSKGNIETPVIIETNDEIHELSKSLDRLRKSVKILMTKYRS
ncbi:cache and HAMP domain-containing protein [Porticoccaceae bacterium]|nr:cache and HAMP domain-containing protein [Porticoccaceae bacterium]